jgi:DNA-directed RNA polymerase subunit RPC12/RpoP
MKENNRHEKPACAVKSAAVPMEIQCHHCKVDIEIWSDDTEIKCQLCGVLVQNQDSSDTAYVHNKLIR